MPAPLSAEVSKMAAELKRLRRLQSAKVYRGCIRYCSNTRRWGFTWRENGKQKGKYFAVKHLGDVQAKKQAEEYQKQVLKRLQRDKSTEIKRRLSGRARTSE